eukprot:TRINITY_DN4860_c0_g1_i2.p3 TRINITY_DN4860_c0_g1~~TRINITY_DN4860_c0_g1_i2.p3  ORF type:complete len:101 (-),score=21.81 TRINITY_DN4860_c0_g1_i2:743-1045(-)
MVSSSPTSTMIAVIRCGLTDSTSPMYTVRSTAPVSETRMVMALLSASTQRSSAIWASCTFSQALFDPSCDDETTGAGAGAGAGAGGGVTGIASAAVGRFH